MESDTNKKRYSRHIPSLIMYSQAIRNRSRRTYEHEVPSDLNDFRMNQQISCIRILTNLLLIQKRLSNTNYHKNPIIASQNNLIYYLFNNGINGIAYPLRKELDWNSTPGTRYRKIMTKLDI